MGPHLTLDNLPLSTVHAQMRYMTLGDCMGMGRLAVGEALRIGWNLAEALRRMHDEGQVHGALTPDVIDLNDTGLEIRPAPEGAPAITAYTAPEVIGGQTADARSDIFAFGAILYEMVAGQRAFNGERETPPSLGNTALDKVVLACVAKDINQRVPRIQRVMLELKLAGVAARKAETSENVRRERAKGASQLQALEARLEARLAAQAASNDLAIEELRRAHAESSEGLREQVTLLCSELVTTQERLAEATAGMEALKRTVDEMSRRSQQFEQRTTSELLDLGRNVKSNTVAIETAQKGQAQNEELLERVIETLEELQSEVMDPETTPVEEEVAFAR